MFTSFSVTVKTISNIKIINRNTVVEFIIYTALVTSFAFLQFTIFFIIIPNVTYSFNQVGLSGQNVQW